MKLIEVANKIDNNNYQKKKIIKEFLEKYNLNDIESENLEPRELENKIIEYTKPLFSTKRYVANFLDNFFEKECEICDYKRAKVFSDDELKLDLIKAMQGKEEITIEALAQLYNCDEDTIKNVIEGRKRDGQKKRGLKQDYYLYGTNLKLNIVKKENGSYCYKRKTMTPIFLGLQLGEVYQIISALLMENKKISMVNEELANRFYMQLSDYGKECIKDALERNKLISGISDDMNQYIEFEKNGGTSFNQYCAYCNKSGENLKICCNKEEIIGKLDHEDEDHLYIKTKDDSIEKIKKNDVIEEDLSESSYHW